MYVLPSLPLHFLHNNNPSAALTEGAEKHVRQLFAGHLPPDYVYHNLQHTQAVVNAVQYIGKGNHLPAPLLAVAVAAAWFHDTGYINGNDNHEQSSCRIMRLFLEQQGVSPEIINLAEGCIMATCMPQNPQNLLEATLADADLYHLATPHFFTTGNLLRQELALRQQKIYSDKEWTEQSLHFLKTHYYHTPFAIKMLEKGKKRNIKALQAKYMALNAG
ncbi:hypothetical protein C7N43_32905 [Sphingobacteriales bacterium UPWRP_1]|nr:hypothetical protein BVG80_01200 [Sphingobacteriales bacterium TSM_CSM]PSJ72696.1 hypothetical protein C7N43_32905 [Sphingobacteriales bacterium UPWRP_1]